MDGMDGGTDGTIAMGNEMKCSQSATCLMTNAQIYPGGGIALAFVPRIFVTGILTLHVLSVML